MNQEFLTPHFSLFELTASATARKHGIENTPQPEAADNLRRLCRHTLEPLREALGLPIVITSGYRCKALNDIVSHHSNHSQHLHGQAADFYVKAVPSTGSGASHRKLLVLAFRTILTDPSVDFDQLILYPTFIHVSYVSPGKNRHNIVSANQQGTYRGLSREAALSIQ